MSLFGRRPKLPPGTADRIANYGRREFTRDPAIADDWMIEPDMHGIAGRHPAEFLGELAAIAGQGGWAALGAERLLWSVASDLSSRPGYSDVMESGLRFLRENNVPAARLTGYEWGYWVDHHPGEEWLVPRELPDPASWQGTPLGPDEIRPLVKLLPDDNSNLMLAKTENGVYIGILDSPYSDEDPRRIRSDLARADTLYDLYVELGRRVVIAPAWADDEFSAFPPFGPSTI